MAALIDASILIEAERGRLELWQHVAQREGEEFFLSVITASELLHGVHRAVVPEVRTKRSAFVEGILERFPLLPVDLATARTDAQYAVVAWDEGYGVDMSVGGSRGGVLASQFQLRLRRAGSLRDIVHLMAVWLMVSIGSGFVSGWWPSRL